ncbi:MAG TPA: AsmA family protein [Bryobacteraceae bacterium]|nr:AsmA family protein [Bryobacteraceae bacterium]
MKRVVRWVALTVTVLLLLVLSVPFWIDANNFKPLLETNLSKALGREVKLGDLKLTILSGSVTANDLAVGDDPAFNKDAFVKAKSLKLQVELWPLIRSRQLNVTGLAIDQPEITLLQNASGRWNFSSMGASSAAARPQTADPAPEKSNLDLSMKLVKITGGRFSMGKTGGHAKPLVLEAVNMELHDFSAASVFPFSFSAKVAGGGDIRLDGKAGPIDNADVSLTPAQASLKVARLDLAHSGVMGDTPDLAGLISFDGSFESKEGVAVAAGRLEAEQVKLVRNGTPASSTLELDFGVQHDLRKQSGLVQRGDIHIGKVLAALTGSYTQQGETAALKMTLAAHNMPVTELAAMLPPLGIVLPMGSSLQGGTATADFTINGPVDGLVIAGAMAFQNTKLAGFDLGKKMSTIERLAGIKTSPDTEIETLSAKVRMAPEGISTEEMKLVVPSMGELNGGGTVSAARELDFKMTAAVHAGGVTSLLGNTPIPFLVAGTCSEPVFRPDLKAVAKEEVKNLKNEAGKAAGGLLKGLLGGKHQ